MALTKVSSKTISDNAITADKIQSGAVTVADISDNSITVNKLHTQVQGALGTRNLLINGDMSIAQRGTSETGITTSGYHTVDRFEIIYSSAGTWTQTQDTDVPTGQGFSNSLKMACTASATLTGTNQITVAQSVEAQNLQHLKYGTSNAEQLTLSFWVKSNKTGTYVIWFHCPDGGRMTNKTYTINTTDTWEKKTLTISGDTLGTINNDNGEGMRVRFVLGSGSSYTSGTSPNGTWEAYSDANGYAGQTVNLADSTSNYINITGVQLEVGDTATPFEHRPYDMELHRCQRYFIKEEVGGGAVADDDYSLNAFGVQYPTTMRAQPTVITTNVQLPGHHALNPSGVFQQSRQGISWYWDGTAYRSIGSRVYLTYAASAEL